MKDCEFIELLNQANRRLKTDKTRVTIIIKGNRLYLRATLPPRPMSNKSFPHQQEIALGVYATVDGLSMAEKEARKVGFRLESGEFSWKPYLRHRLTGTLPYKTVGDWVGALKMDYFMRRAKTPQSLTTWETNYNEVFKRLPGDQPLTELILKKAIAATPPDTRTRQKTCLALDKLAKIASVDFDAKRFAGNYSPTKVSPRSLPSDLVIVEWYYRLSNPAWRWAYGMLATYGLRPHELFYLDLEEFSQGGGVLRVLAGKTGARRVWPLHPEWVEEFSLSEVKLPACHGKTNRDLGNRVTRYFRRQEMPFRPYDLRHCWAIRSMQYGLEIGLAAQQMGHSATIHSQTYHAWLADQHHQLAFERLLAKPDRPRPPQVKLEEDLTDF